MCTLTDIHDKAHMHFTQTQLKSVALYLWFLCIASNVQSDNFTCHLWLPMLLNLWQTNKNATESQTDHKTWTARILGLILGYTVSCVEVQTFLTAVHWNKPTAQQRQWICDKVELRGSRLVVPAYGMMECTGEQRHTATCFSTKHLYTCTITLVHSVLIPTWKNTMTTAHKQHEGQNPHRLKNCALSDQKIWEQVTATACPHHLPSPVCTSTVPTVCGVSHLISSTTDCASDELTIMMAPMPQLNVLSSSGVLTAPVYRGNRHYWQQYGNWQTLLAAVW
jgi:hypothetical protein